MAMQVKTAKAAILAQSRAPLVVDEIALPETLGVGQVLVKVLYSTICGAQLNEIAAAKGPDKFLPHLLGHEASAQVIEIGVINETIHKVNECVRVADIDGLHRVYYRTLELLLASQPCR